MRLNELVKVLDKNYIVISDENYNVLVNVNISADENKYFEALEKLSEIAESDEYIVAHIRLIDNSAHNPFIDIEVKKEI